MAKFVVFFFYKSGIEDCLSSKNSSNPKTAAFLLIGNSFSAALIALKSHIFIVQSVILSNEDSGFLVLSIIRGDLDDLLQLCPLELCAIGRGALILQFGSSASNDTLCLIDFEHRSLIKRERKCFYRFWVSV